MADLPAVSVVEGVPVERPAFLGINISVAVSMRAAVIDPPFWEVDETALPAPGLVPFVTDPACLPRVVMVPVVDSVSVVAGEFEE